MTSKCSIIERNKIGRLPTNWCGKCQKVPETLTLPNRKVICAECGAFLSWAKKTKNLGNGRHRRRAFAHELIGPLRCVVRGRVKLGKHEKFHKHHIIPLSRGGADTLENMAITCSTCHDRSHRLRNYAAALGLGARSGRRSVEGGVSGKVIEGEVVVARRVPGYSPGWG